MEITKARAEDSEKISKLYDLVWSKYKEKIKEDFLKLLLGKQENIKKQIKKESPFFVIKKDKEIIGAIRGSMEHGGVAKISMLCVHPFFRGKSLGRKLIKHFISKTRNLGAHTIYLYTHKELVEAIGLYKSLGFETLCELKNFWNKEDFLFMALSI